MSQNVEVRGDGGDFAEIWVNGVRVMELCSDEYDLTGVVEATQKVAEALGVEFTENNGYEWVPDLGLMTEAEATAHYDAEDERNCVAAEA